MNLLYLAPLRAFEKTNYFLSAGIGRLKVHYRSITNSGLTAILNDTEESINTESTKGRTFVDSVFI